MTLKRSSSARSFSLLARFCARMASRFGLPEAAASFSAWALARFASSHFSRRERASELMYGRAFVACSKVHRRRTRRLRSAFFEREFMGLPPLLNQEETPGYEIYMNGLEERVLH